MITIFNNCFSNRLFHVILALINWCSKLNSNFNQTLRVTNNALIF